MTPEKRKSFLSLLFVSAMDSFGFSLVFVMFAPLLLSPQYHFLPADATLATRNLYLGILFAVYPLTQFFGAPILGDYGDQAGRKKALYVSIIGVVIGFVFSAGACLLTSLPLLIFSRLFSGFFAGNLSICMSAIADLSPDEKNRSRNFGIMTVVWGFTWNFAMLVGGYLSDPSKSAFFGPSLPFWIAALFTLLSLFAVKRYYTETHEPKPGARLNLLKGLRNIEHALVLKSVRPYFMIIFFWTIGWGLAVQWFSTYSILEYKVSQELVSWGLLIQGLFWTLGGSLFNPLLLKKFTTLPIALIGSLITSVLLFGVLIPNQYLPFSIIYWVSATFAAFTFSNQMNLTSIHAPEAIQGKIMGLSQSMMSLGWFVVPLVGAYIGGENIKLFYPAAASFTLIACLLTFRRYHKEKREPQ